MTAADEAPEMCACGDDETFHWARRGACEACACLFFKPRRKEVA